MSPTKTLISKALTLKPAEKSLLIEALLRSLDIPDPKIEKIWAVEAEKRLKAYKAGKIKTVSFEDMFASPHSTIPSSMAPGAQGNTAIHRPQIPLQDSLFHSS